MKSAPRKSQPVRRPLASRQPPQPDTTPHVVVLDPDQVALRVLGSALQDAGFRVSATWSMSEALKLVQEHRAVALVVATRGRASDALVVLSSAAARASGCIRVVLASGGDTTSEADLVLAKRDAPARLPAALHELVAARAPAVPDPTEAAREKARRIVLAVARDGHEGIDHCERLAAEARALAIALGLTPARVLDIELGALLHDIGMLAVRDEAFTRAGPLVFRERAQVQQHPTVGADLLRDVPELHRAIPVVLCHHERPDGSGYPRGLTKHAIPFDARVFQVVDAYEALVMGRPWRAALDHDAALARMREGVGTQFDPEVFAVFERMPASTWTLPRARGGAGMAA